MNVKFFYCRLIEWRQKVQVLLKEYQRFINYALKAVPGQAEFLLSVEKLMFKEFPEDSFLNPVIKNSFL